MPIDWTNYEEFDWVNAQQSPMSEDQRAEVTEFVAVIMGVAKEHHHEVWGTASPPGRFAATVVRLRPDIFHRYVDRATSAGVLEVALKVFKTTPDGRREAKRVVPFLREELHRLPGWPNRSVQLPLHAGSQGERAYIVQEWVTGNTLEEFLRPPATVSSSQVCSIVDQLLGNIVIPFWENGTIWWDFRDANFCFDVSSNRLKMIDVDSISAYAQEILTSPEVWTRRDKGRSTAIPRLRQMVYRLIQAQSNFKRQSAETRFRQAWQAGIEPVLQGLGKAPGQETNSRRTLAQFMDRLEALNF